jgi:hypothetical protein
MDTGLRVRIHGGTTGPKIHQIKEFTMHKKLILLMAVIGLVVGVLSFQGVASGDGGGCPSRRNGKPWVSTPTCPEQPECPGDPRPNPGNGPNPCQPEVDPCMGDIIPEECFPPCAYPLGDTNECDPCDDLETAQTEVCEERPPAIDPTPEPAPRPNPPVEEETNIGTAAVLEAAPAVVIVGEAQFTG